MNGSDFKEEEKDNKTNSYLTHKRNNIERLGKKGEAKAFRLYEAERLKEEIDESFIYVDYPQTSFILNVLIGIAGIEEKAKTNVESRS